MPVPIVIASTAVASTAKEEEKSFIRLIEHACVSFQSVVCIIFCSSKTDVFF